MKASPNREQLLFLIAGGIILGLILVVVVFNMLRSGPKLVEEDVTPPPMVQMPLTPGPAEQPPQPVTVKPAPVFQERESALPFGTETRTVVRPETPPEAPAATREPAEGGTFRPIEPIPELAERPAPAAQPAAASAPRSKPVAQAKPAAAEKPAPPVPDPAPQAKPATVQSAPPVSSPAVPATAAPGQERYAVQLGSFSESSNAESMQRRIGRLGLTTYRQSITVKGRTFLRVRAGPFAARDEAEQAARLVREQAGVAGQVVDYGR